MGINKNPYVIFQAISQSSLSFAKPFMTYNSFEVLDKKSS